MARLAFLLALLVLWLGPGSGAAWAHAQLIASSPADGAVVATAPDAVRLTFNEPVAPVRLGLVGPDGTIVDLAATAQDATVAAALPPLGGSGTYLVSWRVVSSDGHPVGGTVGFSIGAPGARPTIDADARPAAFAASQVAIRFLVTVLMTLGVGGTAFTILTGRTARSLAGMRRIVGIVALAVVPAAGLGFALQGADVLGGSFGAVATPAAWRAALATSVAPAAILAAGSGLLAFLATAAGPARPALAALLAGLAWLVGAGSFAATGHAAMAEPRPFMGLAVFVHAAAALYWLGALVPLGGALADRTADPLPLVERFSRTAVVLVALLAATGLGLAVVQMEGLGAFVETPYGRLLAMKLVGVAALLAIAAYNRQILTPRLATARRSPRLALIRSIRIEMVIGLAVLAIVAGWRLTPPPRALHAADRAGISAHAHTAAAMADVSVRPGRRGANAAAIALMTGDFGPLPAREVAVSLRPDQAGIEPVRRQARLAPDGRWHVEALPLPLAGRWTAEIEILISDFEKTTLKTELEIRP